MPLSTTTNKDRTVREDHAFEDGVREGRLRSLEASVQALTQDVNKLKVAIWMLYGAIALVQFLPDLKEFITSNG